MKFLLDQDVYVITVRFLAALGHDVIRAAEVGLSTASDEDILREAQSSGRLLVTRDRDFGNLVFVRGLGSGVLYLRILPSTQNAVHSELGTNPVKLLGGGAKKSVRSCRTERAQIQATKRFHITPFRSFRGELLRSCL